MGSVTFAGSSKARALLSDAVAGLKAAASGEVVQRAAAKVQAQIDKVAHKFTAAHRLSGNADDTAIVTAVGGLLQLHVADYLRYVEGWLFRSGMPTFIVSNALKTFTAELLAAIAGQRSPLLFAEEGAEEAAAVKSRAKFQKDTAAIARRLFSASPAGAAARAAKAKATRAAKRAP